MELTVCSLSIYIYIYIWSKNFSDSACQIFQLLVMHAGGDGK
jgi:hypothetical protein